MRLTNRLRTTVSAAVVGAVAFGFAGAAAAQEVSSVDDIIVTAQKREQSLQDVPLVVTTLSSEMLQDAGVRDIKDLQILTPGMTVTSTQSEASTTARIRGVGTVGDNPGLESSVGVVIDGVYRSRNGVGFGDLGELSRIEVLKGPQGTLFGRNTSAGVINIITEAPSFTPGADLEVTAGNYGAWGVAGSVTGPISDQIAGRLYLATRERDGFYDIDTGDGPRTATDDANQSFWTARGQLLIQPSDTASIRLIADYTKRDEYCCVGVQIRSGPTAQLIDLLSNGTGVQPAAPGFARLPFSRLGYANRDTTQVMEDMGLSAEANIDFDSINATLTSVTSWRNWSTSNAMDIDYTGADILYRNADEYGYTVENVSQELRLAGSTGAFDWLIGGFATLENIGRDDSYNFGADYNPYLSLLLTSQLGALTGNTGVISPARLGCTSIPGATVNQLLGCFYGLAPASGPVNIVGQGVNDHYSQRSTSFALFTNNTLHLGEQFDLTFGLRYTADYKRLLAQQDNINGNGASCAGTIANATTIGNAIATALTQLGADPATIPGRAQATTQQIVGLSCLPWSNPMYDGREISEDFNGGEFSGTVKGSWRPTDNLMLYASYARGYKGAGYNMDRAQTGIVPDASLYFPAETVDSYELGFKSTLFDGSVLFNATYFNQTFEDFQLNTFLGTAFVVESIPEVTSEGVDIDLMWFTPLEGLRLTGGATYTDTMYGNFVADPALQLLPNNRMSFAPEWSLSGAIDFERDIGSNLRFGLNLSAKYQTEYNTKSDLLPYGMQDAFTVLNGRVSIGSADDRWTVDLWGQNLTDEEYYQVVYNGPLQGTASFTNPAADTMTYDAFLGAPRTYGVTLRLSY